MTSARSENVFWCLSNEKAGQHPLGRRRCPYCCALWLNQWYIPSAAISHRNESCPICLHPGSNLILAPTKNDQDRGKQHPRAEMNVAHVRRKELIRPLDCQPQAPVQTFLFPLKRLRLVPPKAAPLESRHVDECHDTSRQTNAASTRAPCLPIAALRCGGHCLHDSRPARN